MELIVNYLPDSLKAVNGSLNHSGQAVVLVAWTALFLIVGVAFGALFFGPGLRSMRFLERENRRNWKRLDLYATTVDKQSHSSPLTSEK